MAYKYTPPSPEEVTSGGAALREYVGAQADDTNYSQDVFKQAHALIHHYIGAATTVPHAVVTESIKEVGSKLWDRRGTQGGTGFGDALDGSPMLAAKDPLVTVYAVLDRFLAGGFA